MLQKQLALHHGVTTAAVCKWNADTKRRKTIEAEAGVNPKIRKLIGEISELCYISNCQGNHAVFTSGFNSFTFSQEFNAACNGELTVDNLNFLKELLTKAVYGK